MRNTYNNGEWTKARFHSFVKSALRSASQRWPPKFQTLKEAFVGKRTNPKTGRLASFYKCNICKDSFPAKDVQVDHIKPIINPSLGFETWDSVIEALFCEKENLQVVCKPCHSLKTLEEKQLAKERKNK